MKKIILALIGIIVASYLYSQDAVLRVAVTLFDDSLIEEGQKANAGKTVTALFEEKLSGCQQYGIRPSNAIQDYIATLERVQAGVEDPKILQRFGSLLQVDYLIVGAVSNVGGVELDSRIVDVDTWRIVHAGGVRQSSIPKAVDVIISNYRTFSKQNIPEDDKNRSDIYTVGVYKFAEGFGTPAGLTYCGPFVEMLTSALGVRQQIATIETHYTHYLIDEKQLQMSGVLTNDASDVKFQIAGIQYKIYGDMRALSDMTTINYRVFDTISKRIIFTGSVDVSTMSLLREAAKHIAKEIDDVLNNRIGNLEITVEPAFAEIYIDGMSASKPANSTKATVSLEKGNHVVEVTAQGYKPQKQEVTITPKKITTITAHLEKEVAAKEEFVDQMQDEDNPRLALIKRRKLERLAKQETITMEEIKEINERIDVVKLYNGKTIQGAIISRGDSYRIVTTAGIVEIPKKDIRSVSIIR